MRNPAALPREEFCRSNIESAINLHGVEVDDFTAETPGDVERQGTLARRGGTQDHDKRVKLSSRPRGRGSIAERVRQTRQYTGRFAGPRWLPRGPNPSGRTCIIRFVSNVAENSETRIGAATVRERLAASTRLIRQRPGSPFGCGWSALGFRTILRVDRQIPNSEARMNSKLKFGLITTIIVGTLTWLGVSGINETATYYVTVDELRAMDGGRRKEAACWWRRGA